MLLFRVLGSLEVRGRGGEQVELVADKPRRLLVMLLLHANSAVSFDQLIEAVWPVDAPASANGNLKTYVHRLRQLLPEGSGSPRITTVPDGYQLSVDAADLDAHVFETTIQQGRTAADPDTAAALFRQALELWRGDPYHPLTYEQAGSASSRLAELRWIALDGLADAYLASGRTADAVTLLRPLTVEASLREPTWERLVGALGAAGRRADALAAYQEARQTLVTELGVEPGPELRRLQAELLRDDLPLPSVVASPASAAVSPRRPRRRAVWIAAVVGACAVVGMGAFLTHPWSPRPEPAPTPEARSVPLVDVIAARQTGQRAAVVTVRVETGGVDTIECAVHSDDNDPHVTRTCREGTQDVELDGLPRDGSFTFFAVGTNQLGTGDPGQRVPVVVLDAKAGDQPRPGHGGAVTVSRGPDAYVGRCKAPACGYLHVVMQNFSGGARYRVNATLGGKVVQGPILQTDRDGYLEFDHFPYDGVGKDVTIRIETADGMTISNTFDWPTADRAVR